MTADHGAVRQYNQMRQLRLPIIALVVAIVADAIVVVVWLCS